MSNKTITIIDTSLLKGSDDLLRAELGGHWTATDSSLIYGPASQSTDAIASYESGYSDTKQKVDPSSVVESSKFAVRLNSKVGAFRSDGEWLAYLQGGSYRDRSYSGIYSDVVHFDHATKLKQPLFNTEIGESDTTSTSTSFSKARYFQNYERYQRNLRLVDDERLLPNFYFLKGSLLGDEDVAAMVTLEGKRTSDFFTYTQMITSASGSPSATFTPSSPLGPLTLSLPLATLVSTPSTSAIFSNIEDSLGVPRYKYENIKEYLNTSYVDHEYSIVLKDKLQRRLSNIIVTEPRLIKEHNRAKIATNFSYSNVGERVSLYSLMPMANHVKFETDRENRDITKIIKTNGYEAIFMRSLKEAFTLQSETTPAPVPFVAKNSYTNEVAEASPMVVDLLEMIYGTYQKPTASSTDHLFYGPSDIDTASATDTTGKFRFTTSERALNTLNDVVAHTNTQFGTNNIRSIEDLLEFSREFSKKPSEVLAYRIQKIGGGPTGDSRTENTIQNFWFLNKISTIEYIDTQVRYGEDYTYRVYAYTCVAGIKHKLSDLTPTRQIAIDGEDYCLEFYDPDTGESKSEFFYGKLEDRLDALKERADELSERETELILEIRFFESQRESASIDHAQVELSSVRAELRSIGQQIFELIAQGETAQIKSRVPFIADLRINIEPSIKIVESVLFEKTAKVLDNPPNELRVEPAYIKDQSGTIFFDLSYGTFTPELLAYPSPLSNKDREDRESYLISNDLRPTDGLESESVSNPRFIQVYRLPHKPQSYQDFDGNLRATIDLKTLKHGLTRLTEFFSESLKPNKTYYYVFRVVNENGIAGHLTQIMSAELVNDGGYLYSDFGQMSEAELMDDEISEPLMGFKKIFSIAPNARHLEINPAGADFGSSAFEQASSFDLGTSGELWGQTFKIRLTSKKTGKKIDLNVKFNKNVG